MSIQKRLLLSNTIIFSVAFIAFALIVYVLLPDRILAQIDDDLAAVAAEVAKPGPLPRELETFETASTLVVIADEDGRVVGRSRNMTNFFGILDPYVDINQAGYSRVRYGDALLRVYTVPLGESNLEGVGNKLYYLQVARVLDTYEDINRVLVMALLMGFAAATASLLLSVFFTPRMFRPLEDIVAISRQITRTDDLSRRVPHSDRMDEIGDLAQAYNQLLNRVESIDKGKTDFITLASHELRTPLAPVKSCVENLLSEMYGPINETQRSRLEIAQASIHEETQLIENLLDLARIQEHRAELELSYESLRQIIEGIAHIFEYDARQKGMKLTTLLPEDDELQTLVDRRKIKQVLMNLIKNALEFSIDGEEIWIRAARLDENILVQVIDRGIGIHESEQNRIFERYYQVLSVSARRAGGTGIGLHIAREYVKLHGGEIWVDSQLGSGSTFSFTVPLHQVLNGE